MQSVQGSQPFQLDINNRSQLVSFLRYVSTSDSKIEKDAFVKYEVFKGMAENSTRKVFNSLRAVILASQDLELIKLFERAVTNFNSFKIKKADTVSTYCTHYQEPAFLIPHIDLTCDIQEKQINLTTNLTVVRNRNDVSLILDGKNQNITLVRINGQVIFPGHYLLTPNELILLNVPENQEFKIEIHSKIDLSNNQWITLQDCCPPFHIINRSDVLSSITTTIIADRNNYYYRLANGRLVQEFILEDGRFSLTWEDEIPKPGSLFTCVLGNYSKLTEVYTTKSKKNVELQLYVEPGKEKKAAYALEAFKKAMEYYEENWGLEYDSDCLKIAAVPGHLQSAAGSKGLIALKDTQLLVDAESGTDSSFRDVAAAIGQAYIRNYSPNFALIPNPDELDISAALTDFLSRKFIEWLFSEELVRPKDVYALKQRTFIEDNDRTSIMLGSEVIRTLQNYMDTLIPHGFKKALAIYLSKQTDRPVTFSGLLSAADKVLKEAKQNTVQFENWFHQSGWPVVNVKMDNKDRQQVEFEITQSFPDQASQEDAEALVLPFSIQLLSQNGTASKKENFVITAETTTLMMPAEDIPTPLFMHGFCAPVIFNYPYSFCDLELIMKHADDACCRWDAGQQYACLAIKDIMELVELDPSIIEEAKHRELVFNDLFKVYTEALQNPQLPPIEKAHLLQIPDLRALAQALDDYDFPKLAFFQSLFKQQLAIACEPLLLELLEQNPVPAEYQLTSEQMQMRELRNACLHIIAALNDENRFALIKHYHNANNFNDQLSAFNVCMSWEYLYRKYVITDFHAKCRNDTSLFSHWLSAIASSPSCTVEDLNMLESTEGYDYKDPDHLKSIFRNFVQNLACYHDEQGKGYAYVVDAIIKISAYDPLLAHNEIAVLAIQDFDRLPEQQKVLLAWELQRLINSDAPKQTKDMVDKVLSRYKAILNAP